MKIKTCLLNGFWEDRKGDVIDTVVIHYSSAINVAPKTPFDLERVLKIFRDYGVSSHYLLTRRGVIHRLVPEEKKAWHAGPSIMPEPDNRTGVNDFSIGIELLATEKSGFTQWQYSALKFLCADIQLRHGRRMKFVGHDEIAGDRAVKMGLRKEAKIDPGPLFDWTIIR